ncbi:MAG: hypothetical protein KDB53_04855, partial [Planctomycetes bacterium]|nr:hypothetical protein [Planctomycetota bacterium]
MQELAKHFVPVADEVHRLQTGKDADCRLFQKISEQGHYAGRTRPSSTRQGTYAAAPSGVLLASINSRHPEAMAEMLERALNRWNELSEAERYGDDLSALESVWRWERNYPEDGLVLRV